APDRYTVQAAKARRVDRIFIDWLRNARGATSVAAYVTRAREGAPVSTPVRWDELGRLSGGNHYTVANLPRRLSRLDGDPWEGFAAQRQSLREALRKLG
ncbi:MAG: ATP-dependent DNA ligase, partial [Armatimonadetes bacterium]|nr:ATP-dependent DNA ligase [Armatimonadota bacterium]